MRKNDQNRQNVLKNGQCVLSFYDEVRKPRKKWVRQKPLSENELFLIDYPHASLVKPTDKKMKSQPSKRQKCSETILGVIERQMKRSAGLMLENFEKVLGTEAYHEAELAMRPGGKLSSESIVANAKRMQQLSGVAIGDAILHPDPMDAYFDDDPESRRFESKRHRAGEGRTLASEVAYLSEMYVFASKGDYTGLLDYYRQELSKKMEKKNGAARRILEDPILAEAMRMAANKMKRKG